MRHFENGQIAERYDRGRPQLHGLALKAFAEAIGRTQPWNRVIDIACGTGHSSAPLLGLSQNVVGIDTSESMIRIAKQNHPDLDFRVCSAEKLPIELGAFDAMFVANGFHWIDKQELLHSVRAALANHGWFVVYGLGAPKTMLGNPDYDRWYREGYWARYPKPRTLGGSLRDWVAASGGMLGGYASLRMTHNLALTCSELHAMITSQSNVHQAIANGSATLADVDAYLHATLPAFFTSERELFPFDILIEYAQRR